MTGSFQYQRLLLSSTEENCVTAVIPDAVTLSGTVATSEGPATQGEINEIFIGNSVQRATNTDLPLNPDGTYSVRLAPGTYRITFSGGSTHQSFQLTDTVDVTQDRTYNPHLPTVPVIVHLVDANGQPDGRLRLAVLRHEPECGLFLRDAPLGGDRNRARAPDRPGDAERVCQLFHRQPRRSSSEPSPTSAPRAVR